MREWRREGRKDGGNESRVSHIFIGKCWTSELYLPFPEYNLFNKWVSCLVGCQPRMSWHSLCIQVGFKPVLVDLPSCLTLSVTECTGLGHSTCLKRFLYIILTPHWSALWGLLASPWQYCIYILVKFPKWILKFLFPSTVSLTNGFSLTWLHFLRGSPHRLPLLSVLAAAYSYLWASPLQLPYVDTITAILTQWVENPY